HIVGHAHLTLARWIRSYELGWRRSIGEYPHRPNQHRPTAGRLELTRTDKLAPKHAASFGHVGRRRHPHESLAQDLCLFAPKAQWDKELAVPRPLDDSGSASMRRAFARRRWPDANGSFIAGAHVGAARCC